jgi:hypothetical protein
MEAVVNVRWMDGYLEMFEVHEVRAGAHLLWMRLANGANRHIPLTSVRWFSVSPESHEIRDPSQLVGAKKRPRKGHK